MARQSTWAPPAETAPRPEPAKGASPMPAPEPPRAAEPTPSPAHHPGGRSGVPHEPDELDEFTARAQDGDRTPLRLPSTAAGLDDLDDDFAPPQRRSRTVLWVALGAVALGAVAGVIYAARAGGSRRAAGQAESAMGQPSPPASGASAAPQPALYQERSLTAGGYTLRAGLGAAPAQDEPNVLRVLLRDAQGPVAGARIQAALRDGSGQESPLAVRELAGAYLANMDFRITGHHQIKLLVEPSQGGRLETLLDFDVAAPAPAPSPAPERATPAAPSRSTEPSRPRKRSGDKNDDAAVDVNSLPVTVIAPDPVKTAPRQPEPAAVIKPSANPAAAPAAPGPTRAPAPAASSPPAAPHSAPAASSPPAPAPSPPTEPAARPAQPAGEEQDPYRILNNQ